MKHTKLIILAIVPLIIMCMGVPFGLIYQSFKVGFIKGRSLWHSLDEEINQTPPE